MFGKATEKKTRDGVRKFRFNIIDALIIVLVLACIAGVVVRYAVLNKLFNGGNYDIYYITFSVQSLTYGEREAINDVVSDDEKVSWVYLEEGVTRLGQITSAGAQLPERLEFTGADGAVISAEYADTESEESITYTLEGIIKCVGKQTPDGFLLNGNTYIAPGMSLGVQTKYSDFTLKVIGIEPEKIAVTD